MTAPTGRIHLVLYDGVCGLCDRSVRFLLETDRKGVLSFAPLQGSTAASIRSRLHLPVELESLIFVENLGTGVERVSYRSSGVLRILARIGGFWRILSWLRVIPAPIRDFAYRIVARWRYRWFGRFDACKLVDPREADRFLD